MTINGSISQSLQVTDIKIAHEEMRRQSLDALFQTLLHNLMTGKVRVHDAGLPAIAEVPMPIGGERSAVQNPFIRYAVEAGWTYLSPDDALRPAARPDQPGAVPRPGRSNSRSSTPASWTSAGPRTWPRRCAG